MSRQSLSMVNPHNVSGIVVGKKATNILAQPLCVMKKVCGDQEVLCSS